MRPVIKREGDGWAVEFDGDTTLHKTNRAAWLHADKLTQEPISRAEDTAQWKLKKEASHE